MPWRLREIFDPSDPKAQAGLIMAEDDEVTYLDCITPTVHSALKGSRARVKEHVMTVAAHRVVMRPRQWGLL